MGYFLSHKIRIILRIMWVVFSPDLPVRYYGFPDFRPVQNSFSPQAAFHNSRSAHAPASVVLYQLRISVRFQSSARHFYPNPAQPAEAGLPAFSGKFSPASSNGIPQLFCRKYYFFPLGFCFYTFRFSPLREISALTLQHIEKQDCLFVYYMLM